MDEFQGRRNGATETHIESWREAVEEMFRTEEPHSLRTDTPGLIEDLPRKIGENIPVTHVSELKEDSLLGDFIDDLMSGVEQTAEIENMQIPERENPERKSGSQEEESNNDKSDQQVRKLEEVQRYIV